MRPKLYRHQHDAIDKALALGGRAGIFAEMGTGKTRIAIEAAVRLKARRIVIVLPLSAVGVWREEVKRWAPRAGFLDCTRQHPVYLRARALDELIFAHRGHGECRWFVAVGYESFWREQMRKQLLRYEPDLFVYDEAHRLKSRRTRQSKFAHSFAAPNGTHTPTYVLALTGTPTPNGPEDAFSIFKAVCPEVFGPSWPDFEARYIRRGGYMQHQIVGYRHLDELQTKIEQNSYRITKAEALDLPEQVDVSIPITLSPKARQAYDDMRKHAIAEVEGAQGKGTALARVVVTNTIRLQQISSGFVKVEDGRIIDLDDSKARALRELLEDAVPQASRVVVFCRFIHDIKNALAVAEKVVGEDNVYRIDGTAKPRLRELRLQLFKKKSPAVMVAQVQVASLAIDLTAAHVGIFYSPDFSLTNYLQSRDRLHRIGQEEKVTYYHLVATDTIDETIYKALGRKGDLMRELLDRKRAKEFFGG